MVLFATKGCLSPRESPGLSRQLLLCWLAGFLNFCLGAIPCFSDTIFILARTKIVLWVLASLKNEKGSEQNCESWMNSIGDSTGFTYNANVPTRQGWMKLTSTSKFCPFLGRGAVAWISICKEARNPISPGTFDKRMWKSEEAGNLIPRYSKNVSILRLLHGFVTQILRKYRTLLPFQIKEPASFRVLFSKK